MATVQIKCVGKSPILMNRITETPKSLRTSAKKFAESKIYREAGDGSRIGLPSKMLFACLVAAGRNVKNGKKQISTAETTTLPELLSIREKFLLFTNIKGKGDGSWKVDKQRCRYLQNEFYYVRPRFDKWEFEVTIDYDETKIDESVLKALFLNAGSTQGLGAFRPSNGGLFGCFRIFLKGQKNEQVKKLPT